MRRKTARFTVILLVCLAFVYSLTSITYAHPGRTDKNGGHYVRTSGWGYSVGSYHYHNGGSAPAVSMKKQPVNNASAYSDEFLKIQKRLTELGYDCGTLDGIKGPITKNAVIKFQKDNGLVTDGIVGLKTKAKLFNNSTSPIIN